MKITQSFILFALLFVAQINASEAVKNPETSNQTEKAKECPLCTQIAPALKALVKGNCLGVPGVEINDCALALAVIAPHILLTTHFLSRNDETGARARALLVGQSPFDAESVRKFMEKGAKAYSATLAQRVTPIDDQLSESELPRLFAVLEKNSCDGVDKKTCEKAQQLLFRCQGSLWFTLSGEAGAATRSLLAESPEDDAKVLAMMQHMSNQSSQIDEKLNQELKNYK